MGHAFTGKPVQVVGLDCDDTLWHTEHMFRSVHERFYQLIYSYLPDDTDIDQRLYEVEIKNLALFGYGVKGFVLSMIETAIDVSGGRISAQHIAEILSFGKEMLDHPVNVLAGVRLTLQELVQKNYRLIALTKGDLFDQEAKMARSGLGGFFDHVEVVSEKDTGTYQKFFDRQNIDLSTFLMVGNSLRSDVLPIIQLGGRAIYIPYKVTWAHEKIELPDGLPPGAWQLETISGVPGLLSQFRS